MVAAPQLDPAIAFRSPHDYRPLAGAVLLSVGVEGLELGFLIGSRGEQQLGHEIPLASMRSVVTDPCTSAVPALNAGRAAG